MAHGHEHEDWMGADHSPKEHTEVLDNGTSIRAVVCQLGEREYKSEIWVMDSDGKELNHKSKRREDDPGPACEILKFAVDEAKRIAGGHRGAPLGDHDQATPI